MTSDGRAFVTVQEMVLLAFEALSPPTWDYVTYGSETETAVRRNRFALDGYALKPRIARDMQEIDLGTDFLGRRLRIPVLLAPMGSIARFDPEGADASARAAETFGTMQIVASHSAGEIRPETLARGAPRIYALHPDGADMDLEREIAKIRQSGYVAISLATQSVFYGRRDRDLANRLLGKGQIAGGYAELVATHHRRRNPQAPRFTRAALSWDFVAEVRERSGLPLILKGVQTAEDTELAIRHGVDVLYVSNNGGRALDHVRGTTEVLPEVVARAAGRVPVIVDGGFARGTDVVKALALGAAAVAVGRLQAWALAAGGTAGVVRMLEILEEEMAIDLGLMGVRSVAELGPSSIERVTPCVQPHPLSAFPIVMERLVASNGPRPARQS
jgi:glycolate oxidase